MIRLGLRLTVAGGREAASRLVLIVVAVAIGVGLLLATLTGINAVNNQNARYAWLETGFTPEPAGSASHDPLWWELRADYFQGKLIGRVDLAPTGANPPVPPGIAELPAAGQFYASPALSKLLHDNPAGELAARFPGTQVGTIGSAALPSPDSLIVIVGRSTADLSRESEAHRINSISTTVPSRCGSDGCVYGMGIHSRGITLILSVVAAALLFPVLIFIGGATRLSAARREQRFAAMRLVGATPRQVAVISTVESSVGAIGGIGVGFALFFAFRPLLARIPFTGSPFFTGDLSLTLVDVLLVVFGVPIAGTVAARIALRRVNISPLGVSRRVTPRPPRVWRMIPLLAGVLELGYLAYFSDIGTNSDPITQAYAYLAGVFLMMIGLVVAGPWLTMIASRLMARRAQRPATLIAARRLADSPRAGFRAVSGLVLAVFVGTCALAIITTIVAYNGGTAGSSATSTGTLVDMFRHPAPGTGSDEITWFPPATRADLTAIPGVTAVAVYRRTTAGDSKSPLGPSPTVIACAEVARIRALGHCPPGAQTVWANPFFGGAVIDKSSIAGTAWPAANVPVRQLQRLPIDTIVVGTTGSSAAVERARTVLDRAYPGSYAPQTISEIKESGEEQINGYKQLANVVILTSLPIAGCSLAVAVAGGLAERRRPFSLLRLTGSPLAMLRRVVTLEAAAPLVITAIVSAGAGLLAAHLFLRAQLNETLQPPGLSYYLLVVAGLVLSLAVIASTLPLLRRITGPEVARND